MLQTVPELTFLRSLSGDYRTESGREQLRIRKCGYGVTLETSDTRRTRLVGVVGAVGPGGHGVECFAQLGMPNVFRLVGRLDSPARLRLDCADFGIALTLTREGEALRLALGFEGVDKLSHEFRSEAAWRRRGPALVPVGARA